MAKEELTRDETVMLYRLVTAAHNDLSRRKEVVDYRTAGDYYVADAYNVVSGLARIFDKHWGNITLEFEGSLGFEGSEDTV